MASSDPNSIQQLREAVALSPQNLPLRHALADALLAAKHYPEAESEYRAALALAPDHPGLKWGLAVAFHQQSKRSHALVLLEDLTQSKDAPARAYILHARILAAMGEVQQAVAQYKIGVQRDPNAADPEFAEKLGIRITPSFAESKNDEDSDDSEVTDGRLRLGESGDDDSPSPSRDIEIERPKSTFADVGGMDPLKEEIRLKIIYPLTHPEMYRAYGKRTGGGILLYGPPGCGKTHLARATAGEIRAGFINVGIHDILEMWIGNSERNLHQVFERARESKPCVLFFDEVDALGASRSDMKASAGRHLINQFLAELDGIQSNNDGILVLGATNAPWNLDSAFRRPGRFDRILFVPPPDAEGRAKVLEVLLKGKPQESIDLASVAKKCDGFSGADLRAVIEITIEQKLRDAMKSGAPTPIRTKDLLAAAASLKPTTREWFSTARNYALYSNQGGIYDDILKYLRL